MMVREYKRIQGWECNRITGRECSRIKVESPADLREECSRLKAWSEAK